MLCLRHQASRLFVATVIGILSTTASLPGSTLAENSIPDDGGQKHRGSGRRASQEQLLNPVAYRGTGRIQQEPAASMAHRGSGRIDDEVTESGSLAYRGSGRFLPDELKLSEVA